MFTYLEHFIGGMSVKEVRQFLQYVTGSTVLTDSNLFVSLMLFLELQGDLLAMHVASHWNCPHLCNLHKICKRVHFCFGKLFV